MYLLFKIAIYIALGWGALMWTIIIIAAINWHFFSTEEQKERGRKLAAKHNKKRQEEIRRAIRNSKPFNDNMSCPISVVVV